MVFRTKEESLEVISEQLERIASILEELRDSFSSEE